MRKGLQEQNCVNIGQKMVENEGDLFCKIEFDYGFKDSNSKGVS